MEDAVKICVQHEDFDIAVESDALRRRSRETGAIASFTGLVRELQAGDSLEALELEHYPGMTEKSLQDIARQAMERWPLIDLTIIHRVGRLAVGEQIVLVLTSSAHRRAAFEACEFLMDYLKTRAPLWKKAHYRDSAEWVEARQQDDDAARRWDTARP